MSTIVFKKIMFSNRNSIQFNFLRFRLVSWQLWPLFCTKFRMSLLISQSTFARDSANGARSELKCLRPASDYLAPFLLFKLDMSTFKDKGHILCIHTCCHSLPVVFYTLLWAASCPKSYEKKIRKNLSNNSFGLCSAFWSWVWSTMLVSEPAKQHYRVLANRYKLLRIVKKIRIQIHFQKLWSTKNWLRRWFQANCVRLHLTLKSIDKFFKIFCFPSKTICMQLSCLWFKKF